MRDHFMQRMDVTRDGKPIVWWFAGRQIRPPEVECERTEQGWRYTMTYFLPRPAPRLEPTHNP